MQEHGEEDQELAADKVRGVGTGDLVIQHQLQQQLKARYCSPFALTPALCALLSQQARDAGFGVMIKTEPQLRAMDMGAQPEASVRLVGGGYMAV